MIYVLVFYVGLALLHTYTFADCVRQFNILAVNLDVYHGSWTSSATQHPNIHVAHGTEKQSK